MEKETLMPRRFNYLEPPEQKQVEMIAWQLSDLYKEAAPDPAVVKDALWDLQTAFRWKLAQDKGTKPDEAGRMIAPREMEMAK